MRIRRNLVKMMIPAILLGFVISCEYDVPVNEIITARTAIEEAKKYDAEKHAAEDLKKAEDLLLASHDLVLDKKEADGKKSAVDALAAAQEALKKSLPPYAAEKIKMSDDAFSEADLAYAEKFSAAKFNEAGTLNAEAKSLYEKNEYKQSAETAMKSYELAVAARDESLQNSTVIEKEVNSAENTLSKLKSDKFSDAAEGNLANAGTSIDNAKKGMDSKDYKASLKEIETAKKELEAASELIRKQKVYSSIQNLRVKHAEQQKKGGSDDVKEDLDNAMIQLNGAEAALEQNNISDAEIKAAEAEKLILGSDVKIKKKNALAALENAEALLVQARDKDIDGNHKENLDKAETVIGEGKSAVESEKFNDGITSAEEAETVINAVLNAMETEAAELAVKAANEEKEAAEKAEAERLAAEKAEAERLAAEEAAKEKKEELSKTYTVKWRKKNTDCLWRIAESVYKDASFWPAIYLANKDQIKDPDLIFPGQRFVIPPKPQKKVSYKEVKEQLKEKSK